MRLAIALFSYFPYGGLQRDCLRIMEEFRRSGAALTVFTMSWEGAGLEQVEIRVMKKKALGRTRLRAKFVRWVSSALASENYDALIGFNKMPGLDYYYAADSCFAEKAGAKNFFYQVAPRTRQYLAWERSVFASGEKTKIFLISPQQKEEFQRHYQTEQERLAYLPPGINRDRMAGPDAASLRKGLRAEFGLGDDELMVLQVGSGFAVKGVDRSLHAIAALPPAMQEKLRFFIVGDDKSHRYEKLADKLGIRRLVFFLGGRSDIPRFLQGADLLLHPAYRESAGLVILEAVAAGLPVLTTDTCGYAFHVQKAKAGLVCPSPFQQEYLNHRLKEMLQALDGCQWRENGINYGQQNNLYDMPRQFVETIQRDLNSA